MTITLEPTTEGRLREKAALKGLDLDGMVDVLLQTVLDWGKQEQAETAAGIQRGLAASDAGRARPFSDFAEMREKHNLLTHLADKELGAEVIARRTTRSK